MRNFRRVHVLMQRGDSGPVPAWCAAQPFALYDEPAGGAGGGGGGGTGGSGGRSAPTDEGRGVARTLMKRFRGRAEDALAHMADEAKELREERRALRDKVAGFEKPGTRVLTEAEAKDFDEFKALGKPADVKKKLDEHTEQATRLATVDRLTAAEKAAPLDGGFNGDALKELVKNGYELSFVPGKDKDNKDIEIPHVKLSSDAAAKPVALKQFATENKLFGPALLAKSAAATGANGQQQQRQGTQFVEQGSASGTTGSGADTTQTQRPTVTKKYDSNAPWAKGKPADAGAGASAAK